MKVSVCMATYNGSRFIGEQISSILPQLIDGDELIILDDRSKDETLRIIKEFNSPLINVLQNEVNLGHVKTFEKLLFTAKNELIFMSDQDDIWRHDKIEVFKRKFLANGSLLVSDNSYFIDGFGNTIDAELVVLNEYDSAKFRKNIFDIYMGSAGYYGCGMALHKSLLDIVLPFPKYIESHDLWIAMAANILQSNLHIDEKTFYRRIHGENDSLKRRSLFKKFYSRFLFMKSHIEILSRAKKMRIK